MATNYKELRSTYDLAFRQLASQLQRANELQILPDAGSNTLLTPQEELAYAQCCYLQARNALADYLLSRQAPAPRRVEERAYFYWERTGKSSGNDQAHWYRAQASLSLQSAPAPSVSC